MSITPEVIAITIAVVVVALVAAFIYVRKRGIENLRGDVYKLFLKAEHIYSSGEGAEKMDYVLSTAYELLPAYIRLFVTKEMLKKILQSWFDMIKDLLDDGKTEVEEEDEPDKEE